MFLCLFWEKGWWKDVGITSWKWVDMFSKRCEIIIDSYISFMVVPQESWPLKSVAILRTLKIPLLYGFKPLYWRVPAQLILIPSCSEYVSYYSSPVFRWKEYATSELLNNKNLKGLRLLPYPKRSNHHLSIPSLQPLFSYRTRFAVSFKEGKQLPGFLPMKLILQADWNDGVTAVTTLMRFLDGCRRYWPCSKKVPPRS